MVYQFATINLICGGFGIPSDAVSTDCGISDRLSGQFTRNAVPFDPRPSIVTSGLRIGTPALAARGFQEEDFAAVADVIALYLLAVSDPLARTPAHQ